MNAYTLFLCDITDYLVTEDGMAALGDVRCNRIKTVYDYGIVALGASCGICTCASGRLCICCSRSGIRTLRTGLVRVGTEGVYFRDVIR